ncbi:mRNA splicing protein Yju2 [Cordyceps militaris CM01]|uniref:Splicing factor YJU2 n=2 Tax=Cordyceps militaris TaxID=73501 RepID=G3JCY1_CORMM|nr:mRNA splicing protein Yju2 [Cordyceps militaris CM01]ATY66807.1 mRNA splicing Yju2 [Cordyceps militaris]EGX92509.1 mRNA splicing protein Yju2 [Cordyceps militaris CM01]
MSERKVLQKWYPPDFDPRTITGKSGPKKTGPKIQTVRLMAPFSMKCLTCGEFIYRGRKFNSRKVTDQAHRYLNIQIYSFHIKCTRCSAEITFRTDPKNNDYAMVSGAMRNMEPWRDRAAANESLEDRLDRLELEEAEAAGEEAEGRNAMEELEVKNADARREMAAADALDEIRQRNARIHRSEKDGVDYADAVVRGEDEERVRQDAEDTEAARRAFARPLIRVEEKRQPLPVVLDAMVFDPVVLDVVALDAVVEEEDESPAVNRPTKVVSEMPPPAMTVPSFKRTVKKKKDHSALLGIKKKPALV